MVECMRLIIGEVGMREREREGLKIGGSERSRTIWAAVKEPQCCLGLNDVLGLVELALP